MRSLENPRELLVVQCTERSYSAWRLTLSDAMDSIVRCNLMLALPTTTGSFDATINGSKCLRAVYIDSKPSDVLIGNVQPKEVPQCTLMVYDSLDGWSPSKLAGPDGMYPSSVVMSDSGDSFVAVYRANASGRKGCLYLSTLGEIWMGTSVDARSVRISRDGEWILWKGLPEDVVRVNSTHPRVYLYSTKQRSTKQVSPDGSLIIACGFLDSTTVYYTVQDGVRVSATYLYDLHTTLVAPSPYPPITSSTACRSGFLTELLSDYPRVWVPDFGPIPLPMTLDCERITCAEWCHPSVPSLQGVSYSLSMPTECTKAKPVIVYIHGGPAMTVAPTRRAVADSADWYLPMVQAGYTVVSMTYRGTLGCGDEWAQASIGQQGKSDLDDIVKVATLFTKDQVAAIVGGSYGGFLTLHAYAKLAIPAPCFVALYPYISSRGCAAESGDFAWESEYCGVPDGDMKWPIPQAFLDPDVIPHLYTAADVSRPLLLLHGEADDVCPVSQSRQAVNILRQRGAKDVSLVTYPGENHGFKNDLVRKDCIARTLEFIRKYNQ